MRPRQMSWVWIVFLLSILLGVVPTLIASANEILTNESILTLLHWKASPTEIVSIINRDETRFDLSGESLRQLRQAGATSEVLNAMWKATLKASGDAPKASHPNPAAGAPAPETLAHPSGQPLRARAAEDLSNRENPDGQNSANSQDTTNLQNLGVKHEDVSVNTSTPPKTEPSTPQGITPGPTSTAPQPVTDEELSEAKGVVTDSKNKEKYPQPPTPPPSPCVPSARKKKPMELDLDWPSGSISLSHVNRPGRYCFFLRNVNNMLYTYAFTLKDIPVSEGSSFDILKNLLSNLSGLSAPSAPQGQQHKASEQLGEIVKQPPACDPTPAQNAAASLKVALEGLNPGKDSSGKVDSVPVGTTEANWLPVSTAFDNFEQKIGTLIAQLNNKDVVCTGRDKDSAVRLVLDVYVPVRNQFVKLKANAKSDHIVRYQAELDDTDSYDVVVTEDSGGQTTIGGTKTFHLEAGRPKVTGSLGFILTQLPARNYSSVTAPNPSDPTMTQNVLGVDYGSGYRPAVAALLNYNLPRINLWLPPRQVGLALSAGPVFDIASGKADTSHFGFFGGITFHLWNRLFLTPGVHVGEFADFPLGYRPGQAIPAGVGTPQPVKRYTARFAIGITFDAGSIVHSSNTPKNPSNAPASQPKNPNQ